MDIREKKKKSGKEGDKDVLCKMAIEVNEIGDLINTPVRRGLVVIQPYTSTQLTLSKVRKLVQEVEEHK